MLGAAGVQIPKDNLDDLHSSREEDGSTGKLWIPEIDWVPNYLDLARACTLLIKIKEHTNHDYKKADKPLHLTHLSYNCIKLGMAAHEQFL
ncbi:hypothetical protein Tco_0427582 [Tanacetum coccineum]